MTPEERTNLINQLVVLAKENMVPSVKESTDQNELDHALRQMADNVVEQIISLNDNERLIVCMATMTKLLVENVILNARTNV
jgi:CBS-domain-containing membrane protein